MKRFVLLALMITGLLCALPACGRDAKEVGVVAMVNGKPIYLDQLEYKHDMINIYGSRVATPSIEQLKAEYGAILTDLIIQELVFQELEKQGLEITDEEADKAEQEIRNDYPEGAFEEVLVEEYIDLAAWRRQLRARLAMEKLHNQVLRPNVSVDYKEADQYYREHIADFYLAPKLTLWMIAGPNKELVEKATAAWRAGEDMGKVSGKYRQVAAKKFKMRFDRMPSTWSAALEDVEENGYTPLMKDKSGFMRLILLKRTPGKVLESSLAYPIVEKVLVEEKMSKAFADWVESRMASADIEVSTHLLPDGTKSVSGKVVQEQPAE